MDKVSKNRQKKIETVGIFEEKVKRAKALVLADYRGLTHQQLETLKKALKLAEAELVVTKNTLLKRALEKDDRLKIKDQEEAVENSLTGPTATIFAYNDVIAPLKELAKIIKTLKLPLIKLGFLSSRGGSAFGGEWKTITAEDVLRLATLPSRDVLIAQFVGSLKSPIFGLHRALNWNIQKFVLTLKAIESKKSV